MKAKPGVTPIDRWPPANHYFYYLFRAWLEEGGYTGTTLALYASAARLAFGVVNKEYWLIDPDTDFARVETYLVEHGLAAATRATYQRGLLKLAEYLRLRCQRPALVPPINWAYYLNHLPDWLTAHLRAYLTHRRRSWPAELQGERTAGLLSALTRYLRWVAGQALLSAATDLTPALWFAYLDSRLAAGLRAKTLNGELRVLHGFLTFLQEQDVAICARMLRVEELDAGTSLPRDVPPEQITLLLTEIGKVAQAANAGVRRTGLLDRAWFLLMLHSGLRTGEVRRLRLPDYDLTRKVLRIEQSKGLKDRLVYVSQAATAAVTAYLAVRGPAADDHVFLFHHRPLSQSYCAERLKTYAARCGVHITPHQLRHTCATLLLNAGAPILTVQAILGHRHTDTTLGYARLYDGTVAADYYRAMAQVEVQMTLGTPAQPGALDEGYLLGLLEVVRTGALSAVQQEAVQMLQEALIQRVGERSRVLAP
jgi:site-specific recombinase XerD